MAVVVVFRNREDRVFQSGKGWVAKADNSLEVLDTLGRVIAEFPDGDWAGVFTHGS